MFSSTNCRLAAVRFAVVFFSINAIAQNPRQAASGSPSETGAAAVVTTAKNATIHVDRFQLRESPGGQWITERPNRYAAELYCRVQKDGATISRVIPFGEIESIEFTTFVAKDAMYPEVRKMLVKLRNKGSIEWIHADKAVSTTTSNGRKETWKSYPWISGVVSSGEKEQGQDYVITGFTGFVKINGKQSPWEAVPTEIKRIRFTEVQ